MHRFKLTFVTFLFIPSLFIGVPLWADVQMQECGSDFSSGANNFGGRFNANTVANEGAFAALKADGSISVWGAVQKGGIGGPSDSNYKAVYSNARAFAALTNNGSITSWGDPNFGGDPSRNYPNAPKDSGYVSIASSTKAFAAIKADGSITAWGSSIAGGVGAPTDKGYVSLFSNQSSFAALKANGSIKSWGEQNNAPSGSGYISISANAKAFAALKSNGGIKAWGTGDYGASGAPTKTGFISITASDFGFAALNKDGSISSWGKKDMDSTWGTINQYINPPTGNNFKLIAANQWAFAALTDNGSIKSWGSDIYGGKGAPTDSGYTYIVASAMSFVAVKADGSMSAWGGNAGQGNGKPVDSGYVSVVSSYWGFSALRPNGTLHSWGGSDASHPESFTRYPVGEDDFTVIIANDRAFSALKGDGTLVAWGHGLSGGVHNIPTDSGYISINGVGANTETDCQFKLAGGGVAPDSVAPVITLNGSVRVTIIRGENYIDAGATATDDRDGDLSVTQTGSVDTNTVGQYRITYRAVDKAGNTATKTRTVTVEFAADITKPVISLSGSALITITEGEAYSDAGATALDARDGSLEVTTTGNVDVNNAGSYTLTYTATDSAGNKATKTRTVIVKPSAVTDTTKPVITLIGPARITINEGVSYTDAGATAVDDQDGSLEVTATGSVDINNAGNYIITYTATDSAGNKAIKTRTIIVKSLAETDTTKPVITLIGPAQITINKDAFYTSTGATAIDNKDGVLEVVTTGDVDTSKVGTYILTYTATDSAGNKATTTRTIIVKSLAETDTTKPVITLIGPAQITINKDAFYTSTGATAIDNKDGVLEVVTTGDVDTSKVGTYILTYTATDSAGNKATTTRTIIVKALGEADTTKPVITLIGASQVTVDKGATYTVKGGATAIDNKDGVVEVLTTGTVDTNKVGVYRITYTATDKAGNKAEKVRLVTVVEPASEVDTTKPVITLNGGESITINKGETYNELGATAVDNKDGSVDVAVNGSVDISKIGSYTVTYTAVDRAGNRASKSRLVTVQLIQPRPEDRDTIKPTITLIGLEEVEINQGEIYTDEGVLATDDRVGQITITTTGVVDTNKAGTYHLTFSAIDEAGNKASVSRTVVVKDTEKPVITLSGESQLSLFVGDSYNEPGATAADNLDGVVSVLISGSVDTLKAGTYTITYKAIDAANNSAKETRTIVVSAKKKKAAGSMGWMLLLLVGIAYIRRFNCCR